MRLAILLLTVAALFASASALTIKERIQRLEESEFGRHLLDIIQVQMTSNENPVTTIQNLLERLRQDLLNEVESVERIYSNAESDCNRTLPALAKEITKYERKRVAAETRLTTISAEVEQESIPLKENQRIVKELEGKITKLEADRDTEKTNFEEALSSIGHMREGLQQAKRILAKIGSGQSSFLQLSTHVESALNVNYAYAQGLGELAKYFLQLASTADPSLMKHIYVVIDKILEQLNENQYALIQAQAAKSKVFDAQLYQQRSLFYQAQDKVRDVQSRINVIEARGQKAKTDITQYNTLITQKEKEKEDKGALCKGQRSTRQSRNDLM